MSAAFWIASLNPFTNVALLQYQSLEIGFVKEILGLLLFVLEVQSPFFLTKLLTHCPLLDLKILL